MSCLCPMYAYETGLLTENGKTDYIIDFNHTFDKSEGFFVGQAAKYKKKFVNLPPYVKNGYLVRKVQIPCGKCEACQVQKASNWSTRLYLESLDNSQFYFTTLTYDPKFYSLNRDFKDDIQKFLKRIRKAIFPNTLRYFLTLENGDKFGRFHFHLILFFKNHQDDILEPFSFGKDFPFYRSKLIENNWPFGFTTTANSDDMLNKISAICYVARYCCKKFGSNEGFQTMSRRPGIGFNHFENIASELKDNQIIIHYPGYTHTALLDKYLREKLECYNPDLYAKIKKQVEKLISIDKIDYTIRDKVDDSFWNEAYNRIEFMAKNKNKFTSDL